MQGKHFSHKMINQSQRIFFCNQYNLLFQLIKRINQISSFTGFFWLTSSVCPPLWPRSWLILINILRSYLNSASFFIVLEPIKINMTSDEFNWYVYCKIRNKYSKIRSSVMCRIYIHSSAPTIIINSFWVSRKVDAIKCYQNIYKIVSSWFLALIWTLNW